MKAICVSPGKGVTLQQVPTPDKAEAGYLIIKMTACGINPGDITFLSRPYPFATAARQYNIYGASGSGQVIATGEGAPESYKGKNVVMYRGLNQSESMTGTWSEYAHIHYLACAILPDDADPFDYSGSLVNIVTPYGFLQHVKTEGHKGIICTAGNSATGIAMLGVCLALNFPLVCIVRNEEGKKELEALGAKHIALESDTNFKAGLKQMGDVLSATAVFDGVGGAVLNKIIDAIPRNSTIYCYGYLGGRVPLSIDTSVLQYTGTTIKAFSNLQTNTVQNPQNLELALQQISAIIHMPHFKTKVGKFFKPVEINEALQYKSNRGGKAVLHHFE